MVVTQSEEPKGRREGENAKAAMDEMVVMPSEELKVLGRFGEKLMESILARLPLASLIMCRAVCKSWNTMLSSRVFLDKIYHTHQTQKTEHESWLVSGTVLQNKVAFYAPSLKEWRITTVPSLDMHLPDDDVFLKPGMGGLMCLTKYSHPWRCCITDVFIWNPLTNDCRQLPRTSRYSERGGIRIAGMYVNSAANEYKVITVENTHPEPCPGNSNNRSAVVTEIYDSSCNAWKTCDSRFPPSTESALEVENIEICCGSSVFSITRFFCSLPGELHTIVAFEMKTEVWREIKVQPVEDILNPSFVELYDGVYMVASIFCDNSLHIWRLVEHADGRGEWIEADRLPQEFVELLGRTGEKIPWLLKTRWRCTGSGDFLFFRISESPEGFMYRVSRRSWSRLPACDLEYDENRKGGVSYRGLASRPGWMSP